jgi:5'-deoxynucleotidase YfbR-like HD superfamily hydrolase
MRMVLEFYEEVGKLKKLVRTGWAKRGIPDPESVAEHMYRSQFVAYDLAKILGEDPAACAHMMMIHDLPEAKAGDITPHCGVSKEEKAKLELQAAKELADMSGNQEFLTVFLEYEGKQTLRAKICNDADRLECLMQALTYAKQYPAKQPLLEDFWHNAKGQLLTEPGKKMFGELWQQNISLARPAIPQPGL